MNRPGILLLLSILTIAVLLQAGNVHVDAETADAETARPSALLQYNRDVRPILSGKCFFCHGPDESHREADLRLDIRESAVDMEAIVAGEPDESELIRRILSDDEDEVMPPPESHKELTAEEREILRRWIEQGAEYQPHWAYVVPKRPDAPQVAKPAWVANPIDGFILSRLEEEDVAPSAEADRRRLLRRLSLDLVGMPPTIAEVDAFLADDQPGAYERQVERLLASPHYGERMASPWLDLVRFADTVGYHGDQIQRIFPYRDYVINSFNNNKPFDQFTIEQLAGDLLPNATDEQLVASGFNRLNMMTREGGAQPKEYIAKYTADRVRTVSTTWLGSTLGCAECHDHKFDPFKAKDFYSLGAFFADIRQWGVYSDYTYTPNPDLKGWTNEHPFPPEIFVESPYLKKRLAKLQDLLDGFLAKTIDELEQDQSTHAAFEQWIADTRDYLKANPEGWKTSAIAGGQERLDKEKINDREFTLQENGSVLVSGIARWNTTHSIPLETTAGNLSSVRIELLPHEKHSETITRDKEDWSRVRPELIVRRKGGDKDEVIAFGRADADAKTPGYRAGQEQLGVNPEWTTDPAKSKQKQQAVWVLKKPAIINEGDQLSIKLHSSRQNNIGCFRISISSLAPVGPIRPDFDPQFLDAFNSDPASRTAEQTGMLRTAWLFNSNVRPDAVVEYQRRLDEVIECHDGKAASMVTVSQEPIEMRVLPRGDWQNETGEVVKPAVPGFLPSDSLPQQDLLTRLDLANWLVADENPLTSRVYVNRLWKQFFGAGISNSLEDVGAQGESPSHPELLDWLSVEFRESGWDIKHMVRLMVTSSTYRQGSDLKAELRGRDPQNRLLSSQSPRRLEAEFVRDNALAIAGLLEKEIGGPSAMPYQPAGYYSNLQFPNRVYQHSPDERQYRRGLYMHWQRTFLHPMLANFDASSREECTAVRATANTPQQALTLLNDPTFVEAHRVLAERLLLSDAKTDNAKIVRLYELALSRAPTSREQETLSDMLKKLRAAYTTDAQDAEKLSKVGIASAAPVLNKTELAAWTNLCRVVLNLHETITRY